MADIPLPAMAGNIGDSNILDMYCYSVFEESDCFQTSSEHHKGIFECHCMFRDCHDRRTWHSSYD